MTLITRTKAAAAALVTAAILQAIPDPARAEQLIGPDCVPDLEDHFIPQDHDQAPTMFQWQRDIHRHLGRFKQYPPEANKAGLQGRTIIDFDVDRQGRLLNARVARSSGYSALDQAALDMIRRANPGPPLPPEYPENKFEVQIPVSFRLDAIGFALDSLKQKDVKQKPLKVKCGKPIIEVKEANGKALAEDDKALLRKQLSACWRGEIKRPIAFRLRLDRDGAVADLPSLEDGAGSDPGLVAITARGDLMSCGPFHLPAENYDSWREIVATFSPDKRPPQNAPAQAKSP